MTSNGKKNIRALILDMDGVLWRGDQPIGNLPQIFIEIKQKGLQVLLASNNSTKTPAQYIARLKSYGVELEAWQVINSAEATVEYLCDKYPQGSSVYVVGEYGLVESLESRGFMINEDGAIAVVAGMDRELDYQRIDMASRLIRDGATFIGTNPDRTFPTPDGLAPGAGTMLAAIEAAAYAKPTIIGKPEPGIFEVAMQRLGSKPEETLMVGDRLETDILGGQNAGCRTALVLSGVTNLEEGRQWQPKIDFIAENVASLLKLL